MQVSYTMFFYFRCKYNAKMRANKKMPIFVIVFNVFITILACKLLLFSIFAAKECCLMVNAKTLDTKRYRGQAYLSRPVSVMRQKLT